MLFMLIYVKSAYFMLNYVELCFLCFVLTVLTPHSNKSSNDFCVSQRLSSSITDATVFHVLLL